MTSKKFPGTQYKVLENYLKEHISDYHNENELKEDIYNKINEIEPLGILDTWFGLSNKNNYLFNFSLIYTPKNYFKISDTANNSITITSKMVNLDDISFAGAVFVPSYGNHDILHTAFQYNSNFSKPSGDLYSILYNGYYAHIHYEIEGNFDFNNISSIYQRALASEKMHQSEDNEFLYIIDCDYVLN
ncbi:MAG: hypothetical protein BGO27_02230 [Alphaproteobacteria bacterium 33-17]|nr:MAG: hypothetical protein BGO27_02230 [Alphaproteobacteria bacterium 33-17]